MSKNNHMPAAVALSLMASISTATAPDGVGQHAAPTLTIDRSIEITLANNLELLAATERVSEREAAEDEARAGRLPRLEATVTGSRSTNPAHVFGQLLGQEAFTEQDFDPAFLNEPDPLSNFQSRISTRHTLWSGGRIRAEIAAARADYESESSSASRARQVVINRVIEAYADSVLARAQLDVTKEARATGRAHVRLAADLHEAGLVVRSDLLQAEVREKEIEQLVIVARSRVGVSLAALNLVMGIPLDTPHNMPRDLNPASAGLFSTLETAPDELMDDARSRRPDLTASQRRIDAAEERARLARAARMPEIGVTAAYEVNSDDFFGADGSNWSVVLGARLNLFEGGAIGARVRRAESRRRSARYEHQLLMRKIELDVLRAVAALRAAEAREVQTRAAVELAAENLRIVQDRYREGLTTLNELLDAETALTRARAGLVNSQRDLLVSRVGVDLAAGRL